MRHDLVRSLVLHFFGAAGVTRPVRVFTRAENFERFERHRGSLTPHFRRFIRRLHEGPALTIIAKTGPLRVYVAADAYVRLAAPDPNAEQSFLQVIAHEAVHARWPSLAHGQLFDRRTKALLDGYTCPAPRKRLPDVFRQ